MHRRGQYLLLLLFLAVTSALCASPTSFCKCTCFANSTIIPLDDTASSPSSSLSSSSSSSFSSLKPRFLDLFSPRAPSPAGITDDDGDKNSDKNNDKSNNNNNNNNNNNSHKNKKPSSSRQRTCADCNRQFCLDYNLPICKDVEEETDVFATCFQRDSAKDEAVVYLFVGGTVGLLIWSLVGNTVAGWFERIRARHNYEPVMNRS